MWAAWHFTLSAIKLLFSQKTKFVTIWQSVFLPFQTVIHVFMSMTWIIIKKLKTIGLQSSELTVHFSKHIRMLSINIIDEVSFKKKLGHILKNKQINCKNRNVWWYKATYILVWEYKCWILPIWNLTEIHEWNIYWESWILGSVSRFSKKADFAKGKSK